MPERTWFERAEPGLTLGVSHQAWFWPTLLVRTRCQTPNSKWCRAGSSRGAGFPRGAEGAGNSGDRAGAKAGRRGRSSFLGTCALYLLQGTRVGPFHLFLPGTELHVARGPWEREALGLVRAVCPLSFLPTCSELRDCTALSASPGPRDQEGRSWSPASSLLVVTGWPHSSAAVQGPVTAPTLPFGRGC